MLGAGVGAALFLAGVLLAFRRPTLVGRLVPLAVMAAGSITMVASVAAPGRVATVVLMALTVVPMLLVAWWVARRLDRDRDAPTSLDEQPR